MTANDSLTQNRIKRIAQIIAREVVGHNLEDLYKNKSEYIRDSGKKHDVNTPYQSDCIFAAEDIVKEFAEMTERK